MIIRPDSSPFLAGLQLLKQFDFFFFLYDFANIGIFEKHDPNLAKTTTCTRVTRRPDACRETEPCQMLMDKWIFAVSLGALARFFGLDYNPACRELKSRSRALLLLTSYMLSNTEPIIAPSDVGESV